MDVPAPYGRASVFAASWTGTPVFPVGRLIRRYGGPALPTGTMVLETTWDTPTGWAVAATCSSSGLGGTAPVGLRAICACPLTTQRKGRCCARCAA